MIPLGTTPSNKCTNNNQCCERDCSPTAKQCIVYRKKLTYPGTLPENKCTKDQECEGYKTRAGLKCNKAFGRDQKLGKYCCIPVGNPCNPSATQNECCDWKTWKAPRCDAATKMCVKA